MIKSLFSFFLITLFFSSTASANNYFTPGTHVRWNLDDLVANSGGDVTFSAGVYNVNDTVYISLFDTLYITSNATVKFASGTYFDINGTLLINPPNLVTFTAQNTATGYLGMRIDSSNTTILRKLTFEYATALRLADCKIIIDSCTFQYNTITTSTVFGSSAINLFRSSPVITNSQFLNNQRGVITGGLNVNNAPKIIGCLFMGNNTATTSSLPQVNLSSSGTDTVQIINNRFLRASIYSGAISFFATANVNAIIKGNLIRNNRYGINFQGGSNMNSVISYNLIDSNNTQNDPNLGGSGIAFSGGTTHQNSIVTGNIFRANLWGITIQQSTQPNLGNLTNTDTTDDGKNQFINNTNATTPFIDLYNNSADPIFAQNNYWNTNEVSSVEARIFHQTDNAALGLVNYSNFILPVELTNFTASANQGIVTLTWQTKSESNSDYFEIEKSDNGLTFYSIGQVSASANSSSVHSYSFVDNNISSASKNVFYRLKLVDNDGRYKYSQVASVKLSGNTIPQVNLYPSVITGAQSLNVEVSSERSQAISIRFINAEGKLVHTVSKSLNAGNNKFILPTTALPKGYLYVRFVGEGIDKTMPVLKQ